MTNNITNKKLIENMTFDEERALYGCDGVLLNRCRFDGPADGESALKEGKNIEVAESYFNLRYPFWHDKRLKITNSEMTDKCRAPLWYSEDIEISDTKMHGVKALRECSDIRIKNCDIVSTEFGWSVKYITVRDSKAESEYFMLRAEDIAFENVEFKGKYSFQYIKNATFENCYFDTKDAFWHAENVTVKNCVVNGEYLAWYSDGLTLINCKIKGTQPFCYCRNLKLINCEMYETDLSFEKSEVEAEVTTKIDSVKNPLSGVIKATEVGEIIMDDISAKGVVEKLDKKHDSVVN